MQNIFIFIFIIGVLYSLFAGLINLIRSPYKNSKFAFNILSINVLLFLVFTLIGLISISDNTSLFAIKIMMFFAIILLPSTFHFVIRFVISKNNKVIRSFIILLYVLAPAIYTLILLSNNNLVVNTIYGDILYSPIYKFIGLSFIFPITISMIIIIVTKIIRNYRQNRSNISLAILVFGIIFFVIGIIPIQFPVGFNISKIIPISELSFLFLYILISLGTFTNSISRKNISQSLILENIKDSVIFFDFVGEEVKLNKNAKDILHLEKGSEHNSINKIVKILLDSAIDKRKKEILLEASDTNNTETHENDIRFKFEKEIFYYNIKLIPVFDKFRRVIGKILVLNDITLRKKKERRLHYQTYHDSLTNIYNRSYFEEEIKRMDTERQFPISIIVGDINGLKLVNDTFGHSEGDKLIKNIAKILKKNLRHEDVLSRWGGDEFAIILPKTTSKHANNIMKRIKENCKKVSANVMPVSISLGTATKTRKTESIINVVREAENIMYEYKLSEDKSTRSSIISSLQKALEERDFETEEHSNRIAQLSVLIGKSIKLGENKLNELKLLAALHDIGKISITDSIILKPGKLTTSEWKQVKKHPEVGYRIAQSSSDLSRISLGILHHHERWDGNGYPDGLKGENIPLISRIIAIVDAYDAMTNNRPYREAISKKEASIEIKKCAGKQFDPKISLQFLKIIGQ